MSGLEKKEFEKWFSTQSLTLMDYYELGMYMFTQEQLMEYARKVWEKSRKLALIESENKINEIEAKVLEEIVLEERKLVFHN